MGMGRKSARENVELTTLYSLTPVMAVKRLARLFLPRTRFPFSPPLVLSFQKIAEASPSRDASPSSSSPPRLSPSPSPSTLLSPLTREL